mmetsp:Transcript_152562/g.489258  ORF Transcript_152562/g.489258 Transcript_152562/m.489258 type:complete len:341 (+) Transcript_152562:55-1077(+)
MPSRVVYVGSGAVGQAKVSNSPVFGKLAVPTEERAAIVNLTVDEELGTLAVFRVEEQPFHVGWLVPRPLNGHLYGVGGGKAHSWAAGGDGSLTLTSSSDTAGGSAFLELSCDGRWALSARLAVLPISLNGALGMATCVKMHSLQLNPTLADRQEGCHPHQIRLDPHTNKWALSCDLGASRVWVYSFDSVTGTLVGEADSPRHLLLPESAGPRHLDFHPSGRWVYILCELDGCLVVCDWDAEAGRLSPKQTLCACAPLWERARGGLDGWWSGFRVQPDGQCAKSLRSRPYRWHLAEVPGRACQHARCLPSEFFIGGLDVSWRGGAGPQPGLTKCRLLSDGP